MDRSKMHPYWQQQTSDKPLFPNFDWNKPERRDQAGKLAIIGGNQLSFAATANAHAVALKTGIGSARVLLPVALKKTIPSHLTDMVFASSNPSGGLAREALSEMQTLANWSSGVLLVGDAGRNSETALVYNDFISDYSGPLTITRDAIDLVKNSPELLADRADTMIVASFAQLQKLFQSLYYPVVLTFSMQLLPLVEAVHKFTITHPVTLVTLHKETIIIAHDGNVVTQDWSDVMRIWRGDVATKAASFWLWLPEKSLEAATASLLA